MPPPRLPESAAGLAYIVAETVIGITQRQGTSVSTSDCVRGVHKALAAGLTVVGFDFPALVTDAAHTVENALQPGHTGGFCRACASIYVAVNKALDQAREVKPMGLGEIGA